MESTLTSVSPTFPREAASAITTDGTILVHLSSGPVQTDIPDVTGQSKDAANTTLTGKGFQVTFAYTNDDKVDQDKVVSYSPTGKAPAGSTITVTVSSGQQKVTVTSQIGQSQDNASQALTDLGLNPVVVTKTVTDQTRVGQVIDQNPKSGQVKKGTQVTLTVGKAADKPTVPPLQNVKVADAIKQLNAAGITHYQLAGSQDPQGVVQGTNPPAGTQINPDDTVTLFVKPADKSPSP